MFRLIWLQRVVLDEEIANATRAMSHGATLANVYEVLTEHGRPDGGHHRELFSVGAERGDAARLTLQRIDGLGALEVFLHPAAGAPSIANPVVSFYAKKGEDRSVQMVYHLAAGQKDSTVFIDLRVPARALAYRPDGTPFAVGDSVLITITLVDPTRLIADFEPIGLRFSPDRPAHLKISYAEADSDLNGDGTVNATDRRLTSQLRIWGQESAGDPWFGLNSVVDQGVHEVEAELGGFTSYSIGL